MGMGFRLAIVTRLGRIEICMPLVKIKKLLKPDGIPPAEIAEEPKHLES